MTFDEIETALGKQLDGINGIAPIAWPNKNFEPCDLYVEFRHSPNQRVDDTIDGIGAYQFGLALFTVVSAANRFSKEANAEAQKIADAFPKALRLNTTSGTVVITGAVTPGSGFQDGAYWRQPLSVTYITED